MQAEQVQQVETTAEIVKTVKTTFLDIIKPYVELLLENAESGLTFVMSEAPIVIRQFLYFESFKYALWIFVGLLLMVFFRQINILWTLHSVEPPTNKSKKSYQQYLKIGRNKWLLSDMDEGDLSTEQRLNVAAKFVGFFIGLLIISNNILPFVKVTFFPKLYLIEQFIHLIQ